MANFMAELTPQADLTQPHELPKDSNRPLKKPRIDKDEDEPDADEPLRYTEEVRASDLYLDTASAVTISIFLC